ncbi:MAG TPA: hypothetical protein VGA37_08025 [Gemmatimonadales bacterium]
MSVDNAEKARVLALVGDPHVVDQDLQEFSKSANFLSSERSEIIKKYPKQWIALLAGEVRAQADSLPELIREVELLGLPKSKLIIRYIDRPRRALIL